MFLTLQFLRRRRVFYHTPCLFTRRMMWFYSFDKRRSLKNYYVLLNVRMQSASSQLSAQHGRSQNSMKFHDGEESFTLICFGPFQTLACEIFSFSLENFALVSRAPSFRPKQRNRRHTIIKSQSRSINVYKYIKERYCHSLKACSLFSESVVFVLHG